MGVISTWRQCRDAKITRCLLGPCVHEEAKGRPVYIVAQTLNLSSGMRATNGVVLPPMPSSQPGEEATEAAYARSARQATRV
jgi:hypothetical protein